MFASLLVFAFCLFTGQASLEEENARLLRANKALLKGLASLNSETEVGDDNCYNRCRAAGGGYSECTSDCYTEKEVGSMSKYKCVARNECIMKCQEADETKTWFRCMKECPKSLCENDPESESADPESESADPEEDDSETAVGKTCYKDGFAGTVTTDSWCDKRSWAWYHKCSDCKHGYYWYWWHTYCCTPGKPESDCSCA